MLTVTLAERASYDPLLTDLIFNVKVGTTLIPYLICVSQNDTGGERGFS